MRRGWSPRCLGRPVAAGRLGWSTTWRAHRPGGLTGVHADHRSGSSPLRLRGGRRLGGRLMYKPGTKRGGLRGASWARSERAASSTAPCPPGEQQAHGQPSASALQDLVVLHNAAAVTGRHRWSGASSRSLRPSQPPCRSFRRPACTNPVARCRRASPRRHRRALRPQPPPRGPAAAAARPSPSAR